jgi:UDP-glucose 4-epimerase
MRVLVTGGTGFLGSWVTRALVQAGHDIRILELHPQPKNLEFVQAGSSAQVEVLQGNIMQANDVARAVVGMDAIVHLAGVMTLDCAANPVGAIAINLTGSQHVFEAARAAKVTRIVYASSAAVYGPESGTEPKPQTVYGALKLAVEGLARVAHQDAGLSSVGLRPYIVYGAGESSGIAAGPSIALRSAAIGGSAVIRFTGDVGFVQVSDVAAVVAAAVTEMEEAAVVVDLGGDYASVDAFMNALRSEVPGAEVLASGVPLRLPPRIEGGDRPGWFARLPTTSITQGIQETLAHWERSAGGAGYSKAAGLEVTE